MSTLDRLSPGTRHSMSRSIAGSTRTGDAIGGSSREECHRDGALGTSEPELCSMARSTIPSRGARNPFAHRCPWPKELTVASDTGVSVVGLSDWDALLGCSVFRAERTLVV